LRICARTAWKSTSAPLFFSTSGKETVENLKISRGQLAQCQEKRIKRQQTVTSAGCKVLALNTGFLLASMPSYCRFRPVECFYSQSVSCLCRPEQNSGMSNACFIPLSLESRACFRLHLRCFVQRVPSAVKCTASDFGLPFLGGDLLVWTLVVLYSFRAVRFCLGRPQRKSPRARQRGRQQPIVELVCLGEGGICCCGRVHARREMSDRESLTHVQHAARRSFQCRPALREKPGGKPASPKGNRHTRLTILVLWHPLGIDCRADSNRLTDASLC